jgi:hypothetical protein
LVILFSCLNFQPYPDFDLQEPRHYIFVPLPTLLRKSIVRETVTDKEEDDEEAGAKDANGVVALAEDEDGTEDETEDEGEEDEPEPMDIFGTAIAYGKPFLKFPDLEHHAHPFLVIKNALPKFQKHREALSRQHLILLCLMERIHDIWTGRLLKKMTKRRKVEEVNNGDGDDGKDGTFRRVGTRSMNLSKCPSTKARETHSTKIAAGHDKTRGHFKARGHNRTVPALPASQASSVDSCNKTLYDQHSEVAAWAVSAAGPAELTDDTVAWSDEEPVRPSINKWDDWHVPYRQPEKHADFCSSDWPMYFYSYALWIPSWDPR